jgi:hypothetical protein
MNFTLNYIDTTSVVYIAGLYSDNTITVLTYSLLLNT